MQLKNIPAGNYTKISAVYIALIDGTGCTCDNCGRLISNIVTVKNNDLNKSYTIGQDCAKNLFSDTENKAIDSEIKEYVRKQKRKAEYERRAKWQAAYTELQELTPEIDNSNINTDWAKRLFNEKLAIIEAKHGIHVAHQRY